MSPNQFREGFHVSLGGARNKAAVLDNPILRACANRRVAYVPSGSQKAIESL